MSQRPFSVVLWTALALLVGELALEARALRRGWDGPLLAWVLPSTTVSAAEEAPTWGPTADFPFRSRLTEEDPDPGRGRVWVASSSYGEDTRHPPQAIFPNLLVEEMDRLGVEIEVLNASRAGYFLGSNNRELREFGGRWRPDVALLYQMSNDIDLISEAISVQAAGLGTPGLPEGSDDQATVKAPPSSSLDRFVEGLTVYKNLKTLITARLARARVLKDSLHPEARERFEALVTEFVQESRARGAEPVLCSFATRWPLKRIEEAGPEAELQVLAINVELSLRGWLDTVEQFNEVLEEVARREGLMLVDVAARLTGRSELYRDLWHFEAEGHRLVAQVIAEALATHPRLAADEEAGR